MSIPPHLSEANFRRFESILAQIARTWPAGTQWEPHFVMADGRVCQVEPTTFAARLRDAIASYRQYAWPSRDIDPEKFALADKDGVVTHDDNLVYFRKRGTKGTTAVAGETAAPTDDRLWPATTTIQEIEALCVLLHHNRLVGPYVIACPVHEHTRAELTKRFNVSILWDEGERKTVVT